MSRRYGPPQAAAAPRSTWERLLAAALERTLAPVRVDRVLQGLRDADFLDPEALAGAASLELAEAVEQAKASLPKPAVHLLHRLARWLIEQHEGSVENLASVSTERLSDELAALGGIGQATADAILLFGLGRAVYPVDRASFRILVRHGWLEPFADYQEARSTLESLGQDDAHALERVSGWFERIGREFCGARRAKCERCPLQMYLPEGGPLEPD
ncbi:MAG TPA: endonuclease III [Isosphaeraceae bacterium]|nr:endonuclease III [Isosphaeraceae bacterium]